MKQYITIKPEHFNLVPSVFKDFQTEVFMDDIVGRDKVLFKTEEEKEELIKSLNNLNVKRVHCSYWAYPTSFITKNNFKELIDRFGSIENVKEYYGDLSSTFMFERWVSEYILATSLDAQSYTFHLIDYAPIDGMWDFTISKEDIRQAMIFMIQNFMNILLERNLINENTPNIELENAGWGLEHGTQTSKDYISLFNQLYDPFDKVKIGWDINHLLHALGTYENNKACFYLPEVEITSDMKKMNDSINLIETWLLENILDPSIVHKVGSIHLSDCTLKQVEYFSNGKLNEPYYTNIKNLETWNEKEEYGVNIVLKEYDNHLVIGSGCLSISFVNKLINSLSSLNKDAVILHELKNSLDLEKDIKTQYSLLDINKESL